MHYEILPFEVELYAQIIFFTRKGKLGDVYTRDPLKNHEDGYNL